MFLEFLANDFEYFIERARFRITLFTADAAETFVCSVHGDMSRRLCVFETEEPPGNEFIIVIITCLSPTPRRYCSHGTAPLHELSCAIDLVKSVRTFPSECFNYFSCRRKIWTTKKIQANVPDHNPNEFEQTRISAVKDLVLVCCKKETGKRNPLTLL